MRANPLVSILMPMYNASESVQDAIASVQAQSYGHWELLALDDGSSDGTAHVVRQIEDSRIRLVVGQQNRGLPHRLNQAVGLARGALLARMDADDISFPLRLERQVDFLLAHPLVDVVATDMLVVDLAGNPLGREVWRGSSHEDIVARPWSGFHFNHATWLGRAGWFRRHKYREDALRTEDDDLMLRAFRHSRFHRLNEMLYAYRVGPIDIDAVWVARRHFVRSLMREAWSQGTPGLLRGVPLQIMKASVERLARATGMTRVVTGHRADGQVDEPTQERYRRAKAALERATDRSARAGLSPARTGRYRQEVSPQVRCGTPYLH